MLISIFSRVSSQTFSTYDAECNSFTNMCVRLVEPIRFVCAVILKDAEFHTFFEQYLSRSPIICLKNLKNTENKQRYVVGILCVRFRVLLGQAQGKKPICLTLRVRRVSFGIGFFFLAAMIFTLFSAYKLNCLSTRSVPTFHAQQ